MIHGAEAPANAVTMCCLVKPLRCWGYLSEQLALSGLTNTPSAYNSSLIATVTLHYNRILTGLAPWARSSRTADTSFIYTQCPAPDVPSWLVQRVQEITVSCSRVAQAAGSRTGLAGLKSLLFSLPHPLVATCVTWASFPSFELRFLTCEVVITEGIELS